MHKDWCLPFKMPGMEHSPLKSEKEPWFSVQRGTTSLTNKKTKTKKKTPFL